MIAPRYVRGAPITLTRLAGLDALRLLLDNSFDFAAGGGAAFERLAALSIKAPVYELISSSLDDACEAITRTLAEIPPPNIGRSPHQT